MKKLPTYITAFFLAIQLKRVADFVSNGLNAGYALGWAYAIGIAAGVFAAAYWTRQSITRKDGEADKRDVLTRRAAWLTLLLFVGLDGTFNLAETLRTLTSADLLWAAVIYGVSPTVAAATLGMLQGYVDRIPVAPHKTRIGIVLSALASRIERGLLAEQPQETAKPTVEVVIPANVPADATNLRICDVPGCGWSTAKCKPEVQADPERSQRALAGHMKWHSRKAVKSTVFEKVTQ